MYTKFVDPVSSTPYHLLKFIFIMSFRVLTLSLLLPACILNTSCMEDEKKKAAEEKKAAIEEQRRQAREKAKQEIAEKDAARKAAEEAAKEQAAAEERARIEAEEKAEQERLRQLAEIEAEEKAEADREAARLAACESYKGTKFDQLELTDGTIYKDVKVTNADAIGVSIMYEHGLKRIPFTKLPKEICERCQYDPEAAERRKKMEAKRIAAQYATVQQLENNRNAKPSASSSSPTTARSSTTTSRSTPAVQEDPKKQVVPRGSISVRVTKMFSKYYPEFQRDYHTKTLEIQVVANVDASVHFRGSSLGQVKAGERRTFTSDSWIKGEYDIELRDRKTGKILDRESDKSKTNL